MNLLRLLDYNLLGYKNINDVKNFMELIGVNLEELSDFGYYIYGD